MQSHGVCLCLLLSKSLSLVAIRQSVFFAPNYKTIDFLPISSLLAVWNLGNVVCKLHSTVQSMSGEAVSEQQKLK